MLFGKCRFTSSSLTTMNLAANQYSKQKTNQVNSAKFKQARIVSSLLNITTPCVTYKRYASRLLDVLVVLILRVCTWVFYFPVKHSRPYENCGYSRGCKYNFDFFIHTFLNCFPLRIVLFNKTQKNCFPCSHNQCGWGRGWESPSKLFISDLLKVTFILVQAVMQMITTLGP